MSNRDHEPADSPSAETSPVLLKRLKGGVALISLNRPDARNALTLASWDALERALETVATDQDARVVVLTGVGGYFCAGGDLKSTPAAGFRATALAGRLQAAHQTIARIGRFPLPVIAAVEGGAAGLGWSLALACDMIVVSAEAKFVAPFVARGVVPDGGAGWFLARRIGRHRAAELLLAGKPLRGEEAYALGLANHVVAAGEVVDAAIAFAGAMPSTTPHAMEFTKRLLSSAETISFLDYLDLELTMAALTQADAESDRARRAFQERPRALDVDGEWSAVKLMIRQRPVRQVSRG